MEIRWLPTAAEDLEEIDRYLRRNMPELRLSTMRNLFLRIQRLRRNPYIGRLRRDFGTREMLFLPLPYKVIYRAEAGVVEIWRVYHAARDPETISNPE